MAPKNFEASISEFTLAIGSLVRRVRREARSEVSDLSWTQRAVLNRLEKEGAATIAELARLENVKPQSMGAAIAVLEELGLVLKKTHPTDGRQMNIDLTPKGLSMRRNEKDAKHTWILQAISKLSKSDQAVLFASGEIIKRLAES